MVEVKAMDLFEAYEQHKLPLNEGYIVSSFFKEDSAYALYEIVSYSTVKDIYLAGNGLNFQTNGKKLYLLVEPANYPYKSIEPVFREKDYQVPLRFNEANIITCKNMSHVMFNKKPNESLSSFTVIRPTGINFSFIFYVRDDVFASIGLFFEKTLNQEAQLPLNDAKKIAKTFAELCAKTLVWKK
ncbi:MAG: hypothetical protein ACTTJ3_04560 [Treponema sp.]